MKLTTVTHGRLTAVVGRWRRRQSELTPDPRQEPVEARAYRQCANDLELALRDDASLHPRHDRNQGREL